MSGRLDTRLLRNLADAIDAERDGTAWLQSLGNQLADESLSKREIMKVTISWGSAVLGYSDGSACIRDALYESLPEVIDGAVRTLQERREAAERALGLYQAALGAEDAGRVV